MQPGEVIIVASGDSVPNWTGGTAVQCKASGATTGGQFAMFELHSPPGTGSALHVHHREDEALFVLEGEYEVSDAGSERVIAAPAGTYLFLPRGTWHSFRNAGPDPARILIIATPAGLEGFFEAVASAQPSEVPAIAARFGLQFAE
jgi:quercetin dioxygenase-like cupin family protein